MVMKKAAPTIASVSHLRESAFIRASLRRRSSVGTPAHSATFRAPTLRPLWDGRVGWNTACMFGVAVSPSRNARCAGIALAVCALVVAMGGSPAAALRAAGASGCPQPAPDPSYAASVNAALAGKQDVWGKQLLADPKGPTYAAAASYLHPLLLVGPPSGSARGRLTESGVYYLAFGRAAEGRHPRTIDLHVADGSQIVSQNVNGPRLSVDVGAGRLERYGACLARRAPARPRGAFPPGEAVARRLLEPPARGRRAARRPGEAHRERRAQPADPEPRAFLALQPRQPVRALLLGADRRGRGDGRVRVPRGGARD